LRFIVDSAIEVPALKRHGRFRKGKPGKKIVGGETAANRQHPDHS
jgi:hypothetical protein